MDSLLREQKELEAAYVIRFWRYVWNIHSLFINVLSDERVSVKKCVYLAYNLVSEEAAMTVNVGGKFVDDRLSTVTSAEAKCLRPKI